MPQRTITAPGHDRTRSLGWLGTWWIESFVLHGRGDAAGMAISYGDETTAFIVDCYALDGNGRRLYDSGFYSRPKGCDKSGKGAALALFEAFGPCRFAGWAEGGEEYTFLGKTYTYQRGEPMGRAVANPMVRIMATEEGQTGNVYENVYFNLTEESAPLYALKAYGVEPGMTRVTRDNRTIIQPSTAGAASKDGGLETFAVFDETHLYTTPVLRSMFRTVARNLNKRKKTAGTWYLETTTMYAPGEQSIAEETYALADAIQEGRARRPRALFDHRWAEPRDLRDEKVLADAFTEAFGEAIEYNDLEGLIDSAFDTRQSEADTRRYFFNALIESANAWMELEAWQARGISKLRTAAKKAQALWDWVRPWEGDEITLGFDGSRTNDATALVACRVRDRHLFPLHIQEIPDGPEAKDWQVDTQAVDAAVFKAFEKYRVVAFYADPPLWQDYVDRWANEFGDGLLPASGAHAIEWFTKRDVQMAAALERLHTAVIDGAMSHDDESELGKTMSRHFVNARRWSRRGGTVIGKEAKNSPRKIDAAVAAALAFEAASDVIAKKPTPPTAPFIPVRVR